MVGEIFWHFLAIHVSQRDAKELCLPTGIATSQVGISEHATGGLPKCLLSQIRFGIAVVTTAPKLPPAEEALAAADREGNHDTIPHIQLILIHVRAYFFNDAHRLVSEDIAWLHERNEPVHKVKV
jgi:hypothetical protein